MAVQGAPRLAFDIGGTFTDIVLISANGRIITDKVLSIPETIVAAVRRNIENILRTGRHEQLANLVHGTTIASNAILPRPWESVRCAFRSFRGLSWTGFTYEL